MGVLVRYSKQRTKHGYMMDYRPNSHQFFLSVCPERQHKQERENVNLMEDEESVEQGFYLPKWTQHLLIHVGVMVFKRVN